MRAVGVTDPAECVFVGDRPYDDVHGPRARACAPSWCRTPPCPAFSGVEPDAVIPRLADLLGHVDRWSA